MRFKVALEFENLCKAEVDSRERVEMTPANNIEDCDFGYLPGARNRFRSYRLAMEEAPRDSDCRRREYSRHYEMLKWARKLHSVVTLGRQRELAVARPD